jgi:hypothetical protein
MEKLYSEAFVEQALIKVYSRGERTIQSVAVELNMNCHTANKFDERNCHLFFSWKEDKQNHQKFKLFNGWVYKAACYQCKHDMVMDVVIEEGNPADSRRLRPMIKRIQADYGKLPRQVAADEGYARKGNISEAKSLGIKVVGLTRSTAWMLKRWQAESGYTRILKVAVTSVWFGSLHMERA